MQQKYKCRKCGTQVVFPTKFCSNCGRMLNWTIQPQPLQQYQRGASIKIIIGILVVLVIALVVGFVPIITVTEPLTYQATPLVKKEQLDPVMQSLILSTVAFSKNSEEISQALQQAYQTVFGCIVSVRNTDTVSGTFDVHIVFSTPTGRQYPKDITLQLRPGELKEARHGVSSIDADIDKLSWDYKVTPTVTKNKKVPIFDYLLSRF